MMKSGNDAGVKVIGIFKLVKGVLLMLLAAGAFRYLDPERRAALVRFVHRLNVDPGSKYFREVATQFAGLSPRLPLILTGTICYGALFCLEGIGLLMQKRWGEWLCVVVTGSFLPLVLWEIHKHTTVTKAIVIALNIVILVY